MDDKTHLSDTPPGSPFPISRTSLLPIEFNEEEFSRAFRALSTNSNHQNLGFNSNFLNNNNDILGYVHGREIDFLGSGCGTSYLHGAEIDFMGLGFEEQRHGFLSDYSAYQSPISSLQNPNLNLCLGLPGSSSSISGLYSNTHILNSFASNPLMAETTLSSWENNNLDGYPYEFVDYLMRFRNWSASKVLKLIDKEPTLIDELSSSDIAFMSNFKLGSRLLGEVLNKCNKYHARKILTQISDTLFPLMNDEFGRSIFQKLLILGEALRFQIS